MDSAKNHRACVSVQFILLVRGKPRLLALVIIRKKGVEPLREKRIHVSTHSIFIQEKKLGDLCDRISFIKKENGVNAICHASKRLLLQGMTQIQPLLNIEEMGLRFHNIQSTSSRQCSQLLPEIHDASGIILKK